METAITFRPICPQDEDFLYQLYASTREDELAQVNWDPAHKTAFLRMQFSAQHHYYQEQFCDAEFRLVLLNNQPVGRLYVRRRPDELRIVDIALLPKHRNNGIGTALLQDIFEEASNASKPVRIHVEQFNPAMRLYERLGFSRIEDHGLYCQMQWPPPIHGGVIEQNY